MAMQDISAKGLLNFARVHAMAAHSIIAKQDRITILDTELARAHAEVSQALTQLSLAEQASFGNEPLTGLAEGVGVYHGQVV